jgi:hypothetical protein
MKLKVPKTPHHKKIIQYHHYIQILPFLHFQQNVIVLIILMSRCNSNEIESSKDSTSLKNYTVSSPYPNTPFCSLSILRSFVLKKNLILCSLWVLLHFVLTKCLLLLDGGVSNNLLWAGFTGALNPESASAYC